MREIKFRAWDKTRGLMAPTANLETWVYSMIHSCPLTLVGEFFSEHELMQYTGLKDKNGVEIYEGDIVIPFYTVAGYRQKQEVRWGLGVWEPFDGNCDSGHTDRYEVIGNIYENKELLEDG